jgi:Super-infection exclusion protein B
MVSPPDPRWLEILKASGWQTTALAAAFGLFLFGWHEKYIPLQEEWILSFVTLGFLICSCLAIASVLSSIVKSFPFQRWLKQWWMCHRQRRALEKYIPFMTPIERRILAYLIDKQQKSFDAEADGGHARTLLSRGIVVIMARHGQSLDMEHVPMVIPDHLWAVLIKNKQAFPYERPKGKNTLEPHPWRVDWMER